MEAVTPFVARATWRGPHRQTLRRNLLRRRPSFADAPPATFGVTLDDGDVLAVQLHSPPAASSGPIPVRNGPAAVLVHGMGGSAESFYVLETARHLLDLGVAVARVDLRGAGRSAATTSGANHAARGPDIGPVVAAVVAAEPRARAAGVVLVGYSLGGVVVLDYLSAMAGEVPVIGAATVSAPLDLTAAAFGLLRTRAQLYQRVLLEGAKRQILRPGTDATAAERARVAACRSVPELDEVFIAGRAGYSSAYSYWVGASPVHRLGLITVPVLLVHSEDDPVIDDPAYSSYAWDRHPQLQPVLVPAGGHVGFHARGDPVAWHDRRIAAFLAARMDERYSAGE